jgi:hypothetical protein
MTRATRLGAFVLAGIVVSLGLLAISSLAQSFADDVTLSGTVSCSWCRGMHAHRGETRLSCTRLCVSQGASYILVVKDKIYELDANGRGYNLVKDEVERQAKTDPLLIGFDPTSFLAPAPGNKRLEKFAGGAATVTGQLSGATIRVSSIQ